MGEAAPRMRPVQDPLDLLPHLLYSLTPFLPLSVGICQSFDSDGGDLESKAVFVFESHTSLFSILFCVSTLWI